MTIKKLKEHNYRYAVGTYLEADNKLVGLGLTLTSKPAREQSTGQSDWVKETGKRTCCPWIIPYQTAQQSNRHII